MNEPEPSHDLPVWKFVAAILGMLAAVTLGTMFWMWRDTKPRRQYPVAPPRIVQVGPWTNGMVWIRGGTFWMGSAAAGRIGDSLRRRLGDPASME